MDIELAVAVLGVACYVAAALLALVSLLGIRTRGERASFALLAVGGAALAGVLVFGGARCASISVFNRFDAMACYALALSGAYLLLTAFRYTRGIGGIIIPYAAIVLLCGISALGKQVALPVPVQGPWLMAHVLTAYAAYGVFTLASICAAVILPQSLSLCGCNFPRRVFTWFATVASNRFFMITCLL